MPQYMIQFAYARDTWWALGRQPMDRAEVLRTFAERLGGRLLSLHYTMGDFDGVVIVETADDVSAMALVFRAIGGGHLRTTKTTRLYSSDEVLAALGKAGHGGAQVVAR